MSHNENSELVWIWPGWLPTGEVTVLVAPYGLGSTFLLCDLVARVSAGLPMPDERSSRQFEEFAGQCVLVSSEDDLASVLVPRLLEADADLANVCFPGQIDGVPVELLGRMAQRLAKRGPIHLAAIDLPEVDPEWFEEEYNLKTFLKPLRKLARSYNMAVILVVHTQECGSKASMLHSARLSPVLCAAGNVLMIQRDMCDSTVRWLTCLKSNRVTSTRELAFTIASTGHLARIRWF